MRWRPAPADAGRCRLLENRGGSRWRYLCDGAASSHCSRQLGEHLYRRLKRDACVGDALAVGEPSRTFLRNILASLYQVRLDHNTGDGSVACRDLLCLVWIRGWRQPVSQAPSSSGHALLLTRSDATTTWLLNT